MTAPHLWVRAEQRANEMRVGLTPKGAQVLMSQGFRVTVESSDTRIIQTEAYAAAGCKIVAAHSWPTAPRDAIIFGLKELPDDGSPLPHRHILFGDAFKGQAAGGQLLQRFGVGGGTLLDLEYLTDATGRRRAAFGYWAGFAGAAVTLRCWAAQHAGGIAEGIEPFADADALTNDLHERLRSVATQPTALIIGSKGRVGSGAAALCDRLGIDVTGWDMAETAHGGPFPEILEHHIFLNCILAGPDTPVFVPPEALHVPRTLRVIGDIACDPDSAFNPVKVYDRATTWAAPAMRVADAPPLDVMAIDNLPSMLPRESSEDFAAQLLPTLATLGTDADDVWSRARRVFDTHLAALS